MTTLLSALAAAVIATTPITPSARQALVIGNTDYAPAVGPLMQPIEDAKRVEQALAARGFHVEHAYNVSRDQLNGAITAYAQRLRAAGSSAVGFLYYSGHGAANPEEHRNYLITVNAAETTSAEFWSQSVPIHEVIDRLQSLAPLAQKIFVFDACRNELRIATKGLSGGIEQEPQSAGALIAFSTGEGRTAADNGIYSSTLATLIAAEPDFSHLFLDLKYQMLKLSNQMPFVSDGLTTPVALSAATAPIVQDSASAAINTAQAEAKRYEDLGKSASDNQLYKVAIDDFTKEIALSPSADTAYFLRGYAHAALRETEAAVADYRAAIRLGTKISNVYNNIGRMTLDQGSVDESIPLLDHAIELDKGNDLAFHNRAIAKIRQNKPSEAEKDFLESIRIKPNNPQYYDDLAMSVYSPANQMDKALEFERQAVKIAPREYNYLVDIATMEWRKGDMEGAVEHLTAAIQINSQLSMAYRDRGEIRLNRSPPDPKGALDDLNKAISISPNFPVLYALRATILMDTDYNAGIRDLDKAIALDPGNGPFYFARGLARHKHGDYTAASVDYERAIQINPKDASSIGNLCGTLLSSGGDLDIALTNCNKALELDNSLGPTYLSRGMVELRLGLNREAAADFDIAIKKIPEPAIALYGRGLARERLGATADGQADKHSAVSKTADIAETFNRVSGLGVER